MRKLGFKISIIAMALCLAYQLAAQPFPPVAKKQKANLIVVKFKTPKNSNARTSGSSAAANPELLAQFIPIESAHRVFSNRPITNARLAQRGLENIYKIRLKAGTNLWLQLARLQQMPDIAYAEPLFQNELLYIPHDPEADPSTGQQDYLTVVRAYDGWQIDRSDSTMVIGIVDTGVNMAHEDLENIAYNAADTVNGIDDDGDGYIDNYRGWDLANNDNDPTADGHPHGTPVAGISSATINNNIGMAGMGFHSKYLPVKVADTQTRVLVNEYEGIVYAADHGCKVINLSWGGAGLISQYGQDIIDYAVLQKDVVVVAAAGNTHGDLDFYPASFHHVLSVGATDINDNLASWATYSYFIDLMAPGDKVYSTKNDGTYERTTGSSFSAPMVAGAAALVRSHFPNFSALQVMEQLRVTADDIYNVGSNMNYYGQLGKGRLNVQRALSDILTPSIRMNAFQYHGTHDQLIFPGDTVQVQLDFTNYLRVAENVTVTITNPSGNVNWQSSQLHIDRLGTMETLKNSQNPMTFVVNDNLPPGETLLFRIDYVGNNYRDFQYFKLYTVPDYFDLSDGHLAATITSDGDLGFDDNNFREGHGIQFDSALIADQVGLIISTDSLHVMDNIINNYQTYTRDEDFIKESTIKLYDNSTATMDARSVFGVADTVTNALPLKIEQKVLAWPSYNAGGAIVMEYRLINTGSQPLSGLNAGLFADWDIGDYTSNKAAWDSTHLLGYVYEPNSANAYAGLALVSAQQATHRAIDVGTYHGNQVDFDTLFTDAIKHRFLAATSPKDTAGTMGTGNDVAHIVGAANMTLAPNQAIKIAIAMLAAPTMGELLQSLDSAKAHYQQYLAHPPLQATYYACSGDSAIIDPVGNTYTFYADAAASILLDSGLVYKTPPVSGPQMYYAINHDSLYAGDVMSVMVRPGDPAAGFILPTDTLLIESGSYSNLFLQDTSSLASQWFWDFGNGYTSDIASPTVMYDSAGSFNISLSVGNQYGCTDSLTKSIVVAERTERPIVADQQICKSTSAEIAAQNTSQIAIYPSSAMQMQLYAGSKFTTGPIGQDTIFYVVNTAGTYPSVAVPVHIKAQHPQMGFAVTPDTTSLSEKYLLSAWNTHGNTDSLSWFVDNVFVGNAASVTTSYNTAPLVISQVKQDGLGCTDTLSHTINPAYSPQPIATDVMVCRGDSAVLSPGNGSLFYFYDDAGLTVLLHKGKSWKTGQISGNKNYFVTGVDSLLEGAYTTIHVTVDPVQVAIDAPADTLIAGDNAVLTLQKNAQNSMISYWLLEGRAIDTTTSIEEYFPNAGDFEFTAVAQSNAGCYDTARLVITAVNITGLQDDFPAIANYYPNPVQDELHITFEQPISETTSLVLTDETGRKIHQFSMKTGESDFVLSLANLPAGMYLLHSGKASRPAVFRIIKQ